MKRGRKSVVKVALTLDYRGFFFNQHIFNTEQPLKWLISTEGTSNP